MSLTADQLAENLKELSNLYNIEALLIQIQRNITLINQGLIGRTITVNGGSLYALAAEYYSDATLWTVIANANGLVDPELPAGVSMTLSIPQQTVDNGGIYEP